MLKRPLLSIIAAMLLASVSSAHTDPVVVPFNVIIGSTHGDMLPIFGAPVHVGDEIPGTLTYDADAIGEIAEPGLETFNPAGAPRAARRRRCRGAPRRSPAS